MARKKSGGEGGGNAVLVIFLVVFALAAIAMGVMYWTGQEKVAAAEVEKKKATGDIEAANKLKEEAEARLLVYKAMLGTIEDAEKIKLQSDSSGAKTDAVRDEHTKLMQKVNDAQAASVMDLSKSDVGVQMLKLGFKLDPKANVPITWDWKTGGTIPTEPSVTLFTRLTRVSAERERAFRVAEIDRAAATKSGADYVKAKADYDKNLVESRAQVADQIKKLEEAMAKVEADKVAAIKEYKDDSETTRKDVAKKNAETQDALQQLGKTKEVLGKVQDQLTAQLAQRNAEELEKNGAFAVNLPHGSITKRDYNSNIVEINLGHAAGLKAGQTFTVQPSSTKLEGLTKRKKQQYVDGALVVSDELMSKGQIEVVKVTGPNEATARITGEEDNIRDSILKGDLLYNPLFHKNAKDHVVLVGIFDTDGDGVDDIEKVASDLSKRGAVVDGFYDLSTNTWRTPDKNVAKPGPNANTTYVIRGWEFDSSSTPLLNKEFGELRSTINQTVAGVRTGGAQEVRAVRFLSEIGYPLSPNINDQSVTTAAIRFTGKGVAPAPVPAPK